MVLKKQQEKKNIKNRNFQISNLVKTAIKISNCLKKKFSGDTLDLGIELHKAWKIKKNISKSISNKKIDMLYNLGIKMGSTGGKLLGAGGGGYILFYVPKKNHISFQRYFKSIGFLKPKLDISGVKVFNISDD